MNRLLAALGLAALSTPLLATSVGVSISVGDPNYYGRIDVGSLPPPALVYAEPIQVRPAPIGVVATPVYLRVPPGHAKHWRKHCASYGACGQPVYFVQDRWYSETYVPYYRQHGRAPVYAAAPPQNFDPPASSRI